MNTCCCKSNHHKRISELHNKFAQSKYTANSFVGLSALFYARVTQMWGPCVWKTGSHQFIWLWISQSWMYQANHIDYHILDDFCMHDAISSSMIHWEAWTKCLFCCFFSTSAKHLFCSISPWKLKNWYLYSKNKNWFRLESRRHSPFDSETMSFSFVDQSIYSDQLSNGNPS